MSGYIRELAEGQKIPKRFFKGNYKLIQNILKKNKAFCWRCSTMTKELLWKAYAKKFKQIYESDANQDSFHFYFAQLRRLKIVDSATAPKHLATGQFRHISTTWLVVPEHECNKRAVMEDDDVFEDIVAEPEPVEPEVPVIIEQKPELKPRPAVQKPLLSDAILNYIRTKRSANSGCQIFEGTIQLALASQYDYAQIGLALKEMLKSKVLSQDYRIGIVIVAEMP